MLCRLSRLFGSFFASQNYRNQQEITRKQRAEMGQQEAITGAGTMEEAASKWKVGGKTELDPPMYVYRRVAHCWIKMIHRSPIPSRDAQLVVCLSSFTLLSFVTCISGRKIEQCNQRMSHLLYTLILTSRGFRSGRGEEGPATSTTSTLPPKRPGMSPGISTVLRLHPG